MDQKAIISILFAAVITLIGWNIRTTYEISIKLAKLEYLLLQDAMLK